MTFTEHCYRHNLSINRWRHPWIVICTILSLFILAIIAPSISFWILLSMTIIMVPYYIVITIGDSIYKSKTHYYEINRCKECGQFVEPKNG